MKQKERIVRMTNYLSIHSHLLAYRIGKDVESRPIPITWLEHLSDKTKYGQGMNIKHLKEVLTTMTANLCILLLSEDRFYPMLS